jgi:hypothetical protein
VRIAEDTPDVALGDEAGEAIQIAESLENSHRESMTAFPVERKSVFPEKNRLISALRGKSYPLENAKSLFLSLFNFPDSSVPRRRAIGTDFFPGLGKFAKLPLILTLREVVPCFRAHGSRRH